MEPEVHIIEKYFQVVLGCLTMANVKCRGGKVIAEPKELIRINKKRGEGANQTLGVGGGTSFRGE